MSIDTTDHFTWPTNFTCVLLIDDTILPNDYHLTISMMPNKFENGLTSVGLKKIKEFVNRFIQNSIILNQNHKFLTQLIKLKTNTIQIPEEPNDYLFGSILFQKLNSISSNYFSIYQLTIDSTLGDRLLYKINETQTEISDSSKWWNQDNVRTNDCDYFPSWEDLNIPGANKFSPKLLKGGRDDSKQIW